MAVCSCAGMYLLLVLLALTGVTASNILFLGLNEICKNGTEPWTCKAASTCKGLKNGLEKDGGVKLCSFDGRQPIICCPPETVDKDLPLSSRTQGGKKADQKCREYAKYVFKQMNPLNSSTNRTIDTCGIRQRPLEILGGIDAEPNELPHMALIGVKTERNVSVWFCGGSLISPNFVLTAAHCFIRFKDQIFVRLGELEIKDSKDDTTSIDIKISQIINHPLFTPTKVYHDISLLKLEKEVALGPSIRPLCLHTDKNINQPSAIASGWGYTSAGVDRVTSNILQKLPLFLVDDDKCVSAYGTHWPKLPKGVLPDVMMCSGGTRGKDTCQGDSGGPLQFILKEPYCTYSQIGITSFGIGCGSPTPGVYTRVSAYVQWIENIVWP